MNKNDTLTNMNRFFIPRPFINRSIHQKKPLYIMSSHKTIAQIQNLLDTHPNTTKVVLSNLALSAIPPQISLLTQLTQLHLSNNKLAKLPKEIGQLTNLKLLYLHFNHLIQIPSTIGHLQNLQVLHLHHNRLTDLPPELATLSNLKELGLCSNYFTHFPSYLTQQTHWATHQKNKTNWIKEHQDSTQNLHLLQQKLKTNAINDITHEHILINALNQQTSSRLLQQLPEELIGKIATATENRTEWNTLCTYTHKLRINQYIQLLSNITYEQEMVRHLENIDLTNTK